MKKLKLIELRTKGSVNSPIAGNIHSLFKGQGLHFSEVRDYQLGDDIRHIDWNVTAKTGLTHVKVFQEERELNVVIMVDVSASQRFGSKTETKRELATEIAATLAYSAFQNRDKVSLLLFSDQVECFIPPKKGRDAVEIMLRQMMAFCPKSTLTNLSPALETVLKVVKKRSIVVIISDFLDSGYLPSLKLLAKKHDVVPIVLEDRLDTGWPAVGRVLLEDSETGNTVLLNTSDRHVQAELKRHYESQKARLQSDLSGASLAYLTLQTGKPYWISLQQYFSRRGHR